MKSEWWVQYETSRYLTDEQKTYLSKFEDASSFDEFIDANIYEIIIRSKIIRFVDCVKMAINFEKTGIWDISLI